MVLLVDNSLDFAAYFRENFCSSMKDFFLSISTSTTVVVLALFPLLWQFQAV